MKFIERFLFENVDEETRRKLTRIKQLYDELKTADNAERLDEFMVLLKAPTAARAPIAVAQRRKFDSELMTMFHDYMLNELKLKESVAYDYTKRVERICKELGVTPEDFANAKASIDEVIAMYSKGGAKYDENVKKHYALSAALQRFKDFLDNACYPGGTPVSVWGIPFLDEPEENFDAGLCDDEDDNYDEEDLGNNFHNPNRMNDRRDDAFCADAVIYLHETEGDLPFDIKVKHCSEIEIRNRNCTIVYKENGATCDTVKKVIDPKNYANLIQLMRKYHGILNNDWTPAAVAVPFGGARTYEYEFEGKSNYGRSNKLFNSHNKVLELSALDEYNQTIANIINQK